jgi:spore coat polysaccharide biosynthesis protein SpsF
MYHVILQVRSSSKRLPLKAFLDFNGVPLVLLILKRIKCENYKIWVATSTDKSDDLLANMIKKEGYSCFRGPLENVFLRFKKLINKNKFKDTDTVIRITGDNPVVDKFFINELIGIWAKKKYKYLNCESFSKDSLWPKGLNAEFFKLSYFNEFTSKNLSKEELEHVTLMMKKSHSKSFSNYMNLDFKKKLNFSVDTPEDYLRVRSYFNLFENNSTYKDIIRKLTDV